MSSFTEFQALVLSKLCSIEERISVIESVLEIPQYSTPDSEHETIDSETENINDENGFKAEITDFQKKLDEIKSLFDN